jgi:thymidine kinase
MAKDERRKKGDTIYNLDDIRRYKDRLKNEKQKGLVLIDESRFEDDQEILELVEVENENRRMMFDDLDTEMSNLDKFLEDYSKLPLVEDDE